MAKSTLPKGRTLEFPFVVIGFTATHDEKCSEYAPPILYGNVKDEAKKAAIKKEKQEKFANDCIFSPFVGRLDSVSIIAVHTTDPSDLACKTMSGEAAAQSVFSHLQALSAFNNYPNAWSWIQGEEIPFTGVLPVCGFDVGSFCKLLMSDVRRQLPESKMEIPFRFWRDNRAQIDVEKAIIQSTDRGFVSLSKVLDSAGIDWSSKAGGLEYEKHVSSEEDAWKALDLLLSYGVVPLE